MTIEITTETLLEDKKVHCRGCRNDFYNHGGHSGCGHCWSLVDAAMVNRWRINMWTPMDRRENFTRVRVFDCYHGEGNQRDIYLERLPDHLGGDLADLDS